jgi:transketolase
MRDAFVSELLGLARENPRILLITGDLGFGVLTAFSNELAPQFINAGVAEQNMTGLAAGLALAGKTVFTYSIANFPTLRCLEQIRNDVAYHDADVKIVAIGGGFSYGSLGMSHHATEDIAILRALPNIDVYAPCDESETRALTRLLAVSRRPAYLRLDKSKVALPTSVPVSPGRLRCLREGRRVAVIGCGGIVGEALSAATTLRSRGIDCSVYSAHSLKPFDTEGLRAIASSHDVLVTLEEHVLAGGLGSLVSEALMDAGIMPRGFVRIGLPDAYSSIVGSQEYLRSRLGIDADAIVGRIESALARIPT